MSVDPVRGLRMKIRALAIVLPIWVLAAPALCSAVCGHAFAGASRPHAAHAAAADSGHAHAEHAGPAESHHGDAPHAGCTEPQHGDAVSCCDAAPAGITQLESSAAHHPAASLTAHRPRAGSAGFALRRSRSHTDPPASPYFRNNPPLLA
jgi:hypothetical protein